MILRATNEREIAARMVAAIVEHPPAPLYLATGDELSYSINLHGLCRLYIGTSPQRAELHGGRFALWVARRLGVRAFTVEPDRWTPEPPDPWDDLLSEETKSEPARDYETKL